VQQKKTIAIAGTSGKSTTTAMLFHILYVNHLQPSFISGAGLVYLQKEGKIGNAFGGESDLLLIEADESDGTLVNYKPSIGVLLSIDKDHKELEELHTIFQTFRKNTQDIFIVNQSHALAKLFSTNSKNDFGANTLLEGQNFKQEGFSISFEVQGIVCKIPTIGKHNMENALACIAVATKLGLTIAQCAEALASYEGIYRRHQKNRGKREVLS
jgi:UDP-N-acetylmuramate--alanine ligase